MPYNLQFPLCISVFQMEGAYLGFLWISPEVVGSVVLSQACECITKSLFHLLKGLFLCGNAQIIGVQETPCVGMNRLIIYAEQLRGKDAALWKAILLSAPSVAFADEVHIKASDQFCKPRVLCYLKEFPGQDSVVHCVVGCGEVDEGSSSDYTFPIPVAASSIL